ncbi:hypothetical protein [Bosea minatitlanensis]|jgi:hypothetical protein|uniref:Uncharacterized protein n=1 Tax=Bosea minatitlanensis TaxID=128782 RepID=A0ABW0F290_9HYPH|nr:hypothetical protein [Bosea minatitlanensis]MCT4494050.1 hypothetical protein [Bosea minatitlanensis]
MRNVDTHRMPLIPGPVSIHRRVSSALTRMSNPIGRVKWKSDSFIAEAFEAGYLKREGSGDYLTSKGIGIWFVVNPRPAADPDADRRRDLVAYDEVLLEMGPEIALREARPPLEHRQRVDAAVARIFSDIGYKPGCGKAP